MRARDRKRTTSLTKPVVLFIVWRKGINKVLSYLHYTPGMNQLQIDYLYLFLSFD